ncbi:amidohydrolase family protein [Nocardioides pacificus]
MSRTLVLRDVEVEGAPCDVRIITGRIKSVRPASTTRPDNADEVVEGRGGALLPGLHDHHLHLLALAGALASVDCSPVTVGDRRGLGSALSAGVGADGWVRAVGYHESVAGPLDRHLLDALVPDHPVRVQHRSGALWVLNSVALDRVRHTLDASDDVERAADGRPNGRLWRYDARLRPALPPRVPDLALVGRRLAAYGITGVTDATPDLDASSVELLSAAHLDGRLPQSLHLLGAPSETPLPPGVTLGPRKLLLRDHDLPTYDELAEVIGRTHTDGRPVAVHCVTRESLVLVLAVLDEVGALPGDRIEHAGVVPTGVPHWMAQLGLRVVTQPVFLHERGDDYVRDVAADDVGCLYPHASLAAAGVRVAISSDAPFGALDPWAGVRAAVARTSRAGRVLGADERVSAATALAGLLSPNDDPGGPRRRVTPGTRADLCLLHVPLAEALRAPSVDHVRATLIEGDLRLPGGLQINH